MSFLSYSLDNYYAIRRYHCPLLVLFCFSCWTTTTTSVDLVATPLHAHSSPSPKLGTPLHPLPTQHHSPAQRARRRCPAAFLRRQVSATPSHTSDATYLTLLSYRKALQPQQRTHGLRSTCGDGDSLADTVGQHPHYARQRRHLWHCFLREAC